MSPQTKEMGDFTSSVWTHTSLLTRGKRGNRAQHDGYNTLGRNEDTSDQEDYAGFGSAIRIKIRYAATAGSADFFRRRRTTPNNPNPTAPIASTLPGSGTGAGVKAIAMSFPPVNAEVEKFAP